MASPGGGNVSGLNTNVGDTSRLFEQINKSAASLLSVMQKLGDLGVKGARLAGLATTGQTAGQRQQSSPAATAEEQEDKKKQGLTLGKAAKQLAGAAGLLLGAAKFLTAETKVQSNMSALNEMAAPSVLDLVRSQVVDFWSDPIKNLGKEADLVWGLPEDLARLATDPVSPNGRHYFGDAPIGDDVPREPDSVDDNPSSVQRGPKQDHP